MIMLRKRYLEVLMQFLEKLDDRRLLTSLFTCCRLNVCKLLIMYGLDACSVNSTETKSLEFALFRVYAKLFGTISKSVLEDCCSAFGIKSLLSLTSTRKLVFLKRYVASLNEICSVFCSDAQIEIKMLTLKLGQK